MIHYHGGPITPESCAWRAWKGRHGFVSWTRPDQLKLVAGICQSFALDNGAFSLWKAGIQVDWDAYYEWTERWLAHPACDWAIIPDVIGGTEDENDELVEKWPHPDRGVPVWHLNESTDRLQWLAENFPRVALGSCVEYDVRRPDLCCRRLEEILPAICDRYGQPTVKIHGLRMMNPTMIQRIPFSSADSTNVARNISLDSRWKGTYAPSTRETRTDVLVERVENFQSPDHLRTSRRRLARPGNLVNFYEPDSGG